jgi:hypothetical protein
VKAAGNPVHHEDVSFFEAEAVLSDLYALTREDTDSLENTVL